MADNVLRQIKNIVYRLKRQYGVLMYVGYASGADVYNLETGKMTRTMTYIKIRRGIVMPEKLSKDFVYDLSFIAANKNFTYGGIIEPGVRGIIIDVRDLPSGFTINTEMYIVYGNRRYEVKDATRAEDNRAWLIQAKQSSSTEDVNPEA